MSIQLSNILIQSTVRYTFKQDTEEFLKKYYSIYDTNLSQLQSYYTENSIFTYQNHEFIGFNSLYDKLKAHTFIHDSLNINTQPIDDKNILMQISGVISIDHQALNKFTETLLVNKRDNGYLIINTIFKLL